jgi:hypothetical protein
MALSAINLIAENYDERGMVQLLVIMSWQNSFSHYWEVCRRMCTTESQYPIFEYQQTAFGLFHVEGKDKGQEMIGGNDPRFGPPGFNFVEVFGTKTASPNYEAVDKVVDIVLLLCDSINLELSPDHAVVTRETMMGLVEDASQRINSVAKCELGPFRLMILLQGCAHLGVRLQIGKHLREMFFPVKGAGSWTHITDHGVVDADVQVVCREIQSELSTTKRKVQMDEVEPVLCESKEGRLLRKYDTFVKGQSLFRLDEIGSSWLKLYGEYRWRRYRVKHRSCRI